MEDRRWKHKTPTTCSRVVVVWRDIRDVSSWDEESDVRCARNLHTIGWLLYDGPDEGDPEFDILVIAKTYDFEEERWSDFTVFPKGVVKSVA